MLIREILREKLRLLGSPGCWDHLTQQSGLYSCTGLNGGEYTAQFLLYWIYFSNNLEQQIIHSEIQKLGKNKT